MRVARRELHGSLTTGTARVAGAFAEAMPIAAPRVLGPRLPGRARAGSAPCCAVPLAYTPKPATGVARRVRRSVRVTGLAMKSVRALAPWRRVEDEARVEVGARTQVGVRVGYGRGVPTGIVRRRERLAREDECRRDSTEDRRARGGMTI